jgi:ATP-dependent Clp protease ATP-binding subunit ClpC
MDLKPALARGKFRCIGATTNDEYRKYIERDPALERRFQPVHVEEPSVGTTIEILRGLRSKFEQHHTLSYHDKALEQAAILSDKYVADRYLPDKAIDVLDEAGARVRLENRRLPLGLRSLMHELQETIKDKEECIKEHDFEAAKQLLDHEMEVRTHIRIMKQSALTNEARGFTRRDVDMVTETDVSDVISNWTGIPVTKITGSESERLMKMESTIHERIIGQKHAVISVSKAIRRARVGLRNPNRPIASFIFAGPTGVGKTELTKALSEYMFSSEDSMIRLDMSEYMEKHTVAKLIGSPPGYVGYNEGGQLTEAVRSKPYSVVLLDEVEKAHPDVFNLLLQILDDGRLTDSKGRVIDFTNTLIIMTTNLGSKIIERESGIKSKSEQGERGFKITPDAILGWEPVPEPIKDPEVFDRVTKLVNEELKNFFRPEFLNRLDEIIVFNHLTRIDIWEICGLMVKQVQNRLKEKGIYLIVDLAVQAFLTDEGYDPVYGARPLRRAIMKYLEDSLAEQCLSKTLYPNTKIIVSRKKVEGTLLTYTNELEVEVDFSDVDPNLLKNSPTTENKVVTAINDSLTFDNSNLQSNSDSDNLNSDKSNTTVKGARFFKKN